MALLQAIPVPFRVHGEHDVGTDLANQLHYLLDDAMCRLKVAVMLVQVMDVGDSHQAAARCCSSARSSVIRSLSTGSKPPASPSVMMQ